MPRQKSTRLKARVFSYKERGQLSQRKDLDVVYVTHQKHGKKKGNPFWVESCADPSYETSQLESAGPSSPQKKRKILSDGLEDFDREVDGDFVSYVENTRRQTKAGLFSKKNIEKCSLHLNEDSE
jgi:hypothetical protein